MKEYKVVKPKFGISKWHEKMQDLLNQHAREGWIVKHIEGWSSIIFERDKNR